MSTLGDFNNDKQLSLVLSEMAKELRRKRRGSLIFRLIVLVIVILILVSIFSSRQQDAALRQQPHTALIRLDGMIAAGGPVDADQTTVALRNAFKDKGTRGIILRINSPGGSPVQADYIYDEIMRLRKLHPKIPVYAVCTDMCASGAYFIASAANDIYANPSSLIGSIGVIMEGFGFTGAMEKLGITRRVVAAGKNKDFMDPFSKLTSRERRVAQKMVDQVHQQFIAAVETGRGKRLHKTSYIFSGMAWTGTQAKHLGLIDGYGSAGYVARNVIKQKKVLDYTIKENPINRLVDRLGVSMTNVVLSKFNANLKE